MNNPKVYPRAFAHVGITVTDLEKAVTWYQDVFGFYLVMGPVEVQAENGTNIGEVCSDVFGDQFEKFRLAHMSTSNGIGIELFEFIGPKSVRSENNFEYWKTGFFHICLIDPDIEGLANRIAQSAGKQRTKIWKLFPDREYQCVYCEDPFGNIIEIYTHSHEHIYSNQDKWS